MKREAHITAAMFHLVTGQLPVNHEVVEKHIQTFIDRSRHQSWRQLVFHVGNRALVYDMDGEFLDDVELPPHIMLVSAIEFEKMVTIAPDHKADVEQFAHHFMQQAVAKAVSTLRFELTDGNYVNLSVQRIRNLEQWRTSNPEQWRRFVEYDEGGGGEVKMWAIPLAGIERANGDSERQEYHDSCMARGTIVGDRILVPDRVYAELQEQFGQFMSGAKLRFTAQTTNPAPEKIIDERLMICQNCEKWSEKKNRCNLACCGSPFRIADADYQCLHPESPKWYPHKLTSFKMTNIIKQTLDIIIKNKLARDKLLSLAPILNNQVESFILNQECGTCRFTLAKSLSENEELCKILLEI